MGWFIFGYDYSQLTTRPDVFALWERMKRGEDIEQMQ